MKLSRELLKLADEVDKKKIKKQKELIKKIRTDKEDEVATPWQQTNERYKNEFFKERVKNFSE